jgi:hypothetical protein
VTGPREPAYQTACSDLSIANVVNPAVDAAPATRTIGQMSAPANRTIRQTAGLATRTIGQMAGLATRIIGQRAAPATKTIGQTAAPATKTIGQTAAPANRAIGQAAAQPETARLMGGDGAFSIESWPCDDLENTYIPLETLFIQAAVLGFRVFLCGGTGDDHPPVYSRDCDILENEVWREGPSMFFKRLLFSLTAMGVDTLVAVGGRDADLNGPLASVEIYRDGRGTWEVAPWELTLAREAHCAVALDSVELIMIGGFNGRYGPLSLVEKYNVESGSVTAWPDLPMPLSGHACAIHLTEGSLYVSGGSKNFLAEVAQLDLVTLTWSFLPRLNVGRTYHTMGVLNGALAVFGGLSELNDKRGEATLEIFNGTEWQTRELGRARYGHTMVLVPCP